MIWQLVALNNQRLEEGKKIINQLSHRANLTGEEVADLLCARRETRCYSKFAGPLVGCWVALITGMTTTIVFTLMACAGNRK